MKLEDLRKKPHLSSSSINGYVECGLAYMFAKVDRRPPEFRSDAMEFGSVIHQVLGDYYRELMHGTELSRKILLQRFETYWTQAAEDNADIRYKKGQTFASLLRYGKDLLTVWHANRNDDGTRVLAIEEPFSFELEGLEIPIIGAMDLLEEDRSGTLIITDFKTSGRAYSEREVDANQQLTLYQMAARANGCRDREILLRFDCLIKTKTPKFQQYWTFRFEADEQRLIRKIRTVWNGIQKGVFIPNDNSWKCPACCYQNACNEWFTGGGS